MFFQIQLVHYYSSFAIGKHIIIILFDPQKQYIYVCVTKVTTSPAPQPSSYKANIRQFAIWPFLILHQSQKQNAHNIVT